MNKNLIKFFVIVSFLAMVIVNGLANTLPINGITTGDISNSYPNLFAPAAITFSIWGIIYLLLAIYSIYQLKNDKYEKIRIYFILSSLANMLWIFSWHYKLIGLSVIFILSILFFLIKIVDQLNKEKLSNKEKRFIQLPFSVYFGWITVAVIANITTFLVSINWNGLGISDDVWTIVILLIGTIIGIKRTLQDKSVAYGLVLFWAYSGIFLKHTSSNGFAGQYANIITTIIVCIFLFLITISSLILKKNKK